MLMDVPNAYCVIHFACCREIKKMSDLEVEKLKELLDLKRARELEAQLAKEQEETKERPVSHSAINLQSAMRVSRGETCISLAP